MSWQDIEFERPIPLPDGGTLKNLDDADGYIDPLPKRHSYMPD